MQIAGDQSISLRPKADGASAEIIIAGTPTGTSVEGRVLEAVLVCNSDYVLFVTTDTPFEETLSIYLVDQAGTVLDKAWVGAPYATGHFADLRIDGADHVRFRFMGNTDWMLQVLPHSRFFFPFLADVPGVRRPLGFYRRLIIQGSPQPQR